MHALTQVHVTIRMDDAFTLNCHPTVPMGCEEQVVDAKCTRPFLPVVKGLAPRLITSPSARQRDQWYTHIITIGINIHCRKFSKARAIQTTYPHLRSDSTTLCTYIMLYTLCADNLTNYNRYQHVKLSLPHWVSHVLNKG